MPPGKDGSGSWAKRHQPVIIRAAATAALPAARPTRLPPHVLPANHFRPRHAVLHAARGSSDGGARQHQGLARDAQGQPALAIAGRLQAGPPARARGRPTRSARSWWTASSPRSSARTSKRWVRRSTRSPSRSRSSPTAIRWPCSTCDGIDFAPRAAMLEQAAAVVVEMVHELRNMKLERMKELNDRLRSLETEADRLMLELLSRHLFRQARPPADVPAQGILRDPGKGHRPLPRGGRRRLRDRAEELVSGSTDGDAPC